MTILLVVMSSAATGALLLVSPLAVLLIAGAVVASVLATRASDGLAVGIVVIASFMSRLTVPIGHNHLRPENFATLLLLARVVGHRRRLSRLSRTQVLLFCGLLFLESISTLANSVSKSASSTILVWLALDGLLLWSLLRVDRCHRKHSVLSIGLPTATVNNLAAVALWLAALTGYGGFGVQTDPTYGGHAAYVLSLEANITGALAALWGLVGLTFMRSARYRRWAVMAFVTAPFAIIATQTRAAMIAFVFGGLVIALARGALRPFQLAAALLLGIAALQGVRLLSTTQGGAAAAAKFSDYSLSTGDGALRVRSWSLAVQDMGPEQLIVGLGTNSFGQRHSKIIYPGKIVPAYLGSLPFQIAYDAGIPAVASVLAVFILARPRSRRGRAAYIGLGACYMILSLSTSPFWFGTTWILLALGRDSNKVVVEGAPAGSEIAVMPSRPRRPVLTR